jgi:hypothetical protein
VWELQVRGGALSQAAVWKPACLIFDAATPRRRRSLYPKTSKARPPTPGVKLQYVLPTSTFEFGPLLAGRLQPQAVAEGTLPDSHPDHTARFKIANSGLFPLHADFWLKSEGEPADSDPSRGGGRRGTQPGAPGTGAASPGATARGSPGKGPPAGAGPLTLLPRSMDLRVGEAQDLLVLAYPQAEGAVTDAVMCRWVGGMPLVAAGAALPPAGGACACPLKLLADPGGCCCVRAHS